MNILFLSKEYPPETGWGGIGTYVYNIAHALSERGHSVHVITLAITSPSEIPSSPPFKKGGKGGIFVHRIRPIKFPTPLLNNFLFKSLEIIKFNIAIISRIWEIVKKEKIDIIEAPEWRSEAFLLSFLKHKRIPLVIKCHSPSILLNEIYNPPVPPFQNLPFPLLINEGKKGRLKGGGVGMDLRFVEWIEKITIRKADLVVSPSKNLAEIVSEKMGIKREDIKIIPNPIDTETFSPLYTSDFKIRNSKFEIQNLKVLFVGRLDRLKGAHIFGEAIPLILKDVPDTSFVMVGRDTDTGPNNSSMKSYIRSLIPQEIQDRVIFTGNVERANLVDYYRESCVCVAPSFYENFPNTVLEAMSCGKAVVASRTGGIPEVIEDGVSGILSNTGDAGDFAEKIIMLLKDDTLRRNMGINARKRIEERYAKDVVVREAELLYQGLVR